jgi:hypothetical protein
MHMTFGEFCALFKIEPSPDVFRFWLLSHLLPPNLEVSVIARAAQPSPRQKVL